MRANSLYIKTMNYFNYKLNSKNTRLNHAKIELGNIDKT